MEHGRNRRITIVFSLKSCYIAQSQLLRALYRICNRVPVAFKKPAFRCGNKSSLLNADSLGGLRIDPRPLLYDSRALPLPCTSIGSERDITIDEILPEVRVIS